MVPNLFVTADRSTLDNFTADPETKPDLQVKVCETLGAESVDLWPARYFQKSNQYAYLHINRNNEADKSLNVAEHEPVPTRLLNPNASDASYNLKQ